MMRTEDPVAIRLEDYRPVDYHVEQVDLEFELRPEQTVVRSRLTVRRNNTGGGAQPLRLDGEALKLNAIKLDDEPLDSDAYATDDSGLTVYQVPERFVLDIETEIDPGNNTALEGLYMSKNMFCTQCEAEGFRRITYYIDRPDNMAVFRTRIIANKTDFPVLLSNGNLTGRGDLDNDRHWVEWHDPFAKPCYLFALVAGDLACVQSLYTTKSGREVVLKIFVEPGDEKRCDYAMDALKRSMKWDEERYGREYDLNTFMIVAVSHFNMGAMENKGLNIFNSQYILARPETATDIDYSLIESIIAHEYFHNWTGNRITCRDWFQLCLKEGLTVFRDQQFSADMRSPTVQRIKDVRALRFRQFAEDSGPLAHPVRPSTYYKIDNFYTATVYEKGAEVVRMLHTLLGEAGFRTGMDTYFSRHDGKAVTIEDFLKCFSDATGTDLTQFHLWYLQPGTPSLSVETAFDGAQQRFAVTFRQRFAHEQAAKNLPCLIPIRFGLLDEEGHDLEVADQDGLDAERSILFLKEAEKTFVFEGLEREPHLSLLRNFSAPVNLNYGLSRGERAFLIAHDKDEFNRWDNSQAFAREIIFDVMDQLRDGDDPDCDRRFLDSLRKLLRTDGADPAFLAETLNFPGEMDLARDLDVIEPELLHRARNAFLETIGRALEDDLNEIYARHRIAAPYDPSIAQAGPRALRNMALWLLVRSGKAAYVRLARQHFDEAQNMTDRMAALTAVNDLADPVRDEMLHAFFEHWKHDELVLNKWLRLEALSARERVIMRIRSLLDHDAFELTNPNKVRALIGTFAHLNHVRFHDLSGDGYSLFTKIINQLDSLNPQTAARLTSAYENWRRYDPERKNLMKLQLDAIINRDGASKNVLEIASKIRGSR